VILRRWWQILVVLSALVALGMTLVWVLGPGRGSAEALALAQRAAQALETVTIKGTVRTLALSPRGPVEARAEVHRGEGRVHIRYLSGPAEGMEVHRDGASVWSCGPEGAERHRAQIGDAGWSHELMRRNWQFRLRGEASVAGRPAALLTARGPGGRLAVAADRETGFPLLLKRSAPDGRTLSETVWETADFSVAPPPQVEPPADTQVAERSRRRRVPVEEAQQAVDFTLLAPARLPSGFALDGWFVRERRRGVVVEARYTDGLRPLLVIEQSARAAAAEPDGPERPDRVAREGQRRGPGDGPPADGPARQPGHMHDRPMMGGRGMHHGPMMHMRGAGGRAVRREIDGVLVTVIGPDLGEALTDVLESMEPVQVQ